MKKNTIFEFFDFLCGKITNCFLTKNTLSKLDLTESNERSSIDFLSTLWSSCWRKSLRMSLLFGAIMMMGYTATAQNIKGIVPVSTPKLGSGVDGNAWAHEPDMFNSAPSIYSNVGDLFDKLHPDISGHGLVNPFTGDVFYKPSPLQNPPIAQSIPVTYQIKDNYIGDFTIFTKSNKINDNPNTYEWGPGTSPNKNEIQNCGAHFSYGEQGMAGGVYNDSEVLVKAITGSDKDLWCLFAGDRQVTNGSSYIDFEFLQASLTMTGAQYGAVDPQTGVAAINGGSGVFLTDAPDSTGGRTEGDLLVTIQFTQGGGEATVVIQSWTNVNGTWQYIPLDNNSVGVLGNIFCTNNNVTTTVPFDVYGVFPGTYVPNQWAEGAINLTQVFKFLDKPCVNISTLFIRTRTSGNSAQSELKDFPGAPIQLNLTFKPDAPTVTSVTRCGPGVVDLLASGCGNGGTLKWFDAAVDGNQVATGGAYSPSISQTTSYWVSCTSATGCEGPRTEVTGTVNVINPGTIAGTQTLCTPFNPAAFTSTTDATGNGTITYQWQISTTGCDGTWSDIAGATSATYDAPAVSVVTNFRRVATSTLNGLACPANSNCLTVTPNNVTSGSIAGDQTLCTPFNPAAFTSTTAGTGSGTITYQWQISTTGCAGTWSDIARATSATYDAPVVSVITNFRRVTTSTLNGVTCSANSNCLTVTPNAITPGVIAGNQTICSGGNPAAFTNTTPGSGDGSITYQWQSGSGTCATATFTDIVGATSATYDVPTGLAATTSYRRVATSTLNGVPCSATSNCITVTVINVTPGTIAASQTICSGGDPAAFTQTVAAQGSNLTYQWQSGTGSCDTATFTNIVGATSVTYDVPAGLTTTTSYRRIANSTDAECPAISNCLTVTVNNVSSGSIAGDQTLCSPFNPAAFTSTTAGTGSGVITYQWQSNTTGCGGAFNDIVGATSATYDPSLASVTTYYRRITISTLNGVVCSANSNCLTVTPNNVSSGSIAGDQTLCSPFDPAAFTSTTAGTGSGTVTYQWQISTTGCAGTWSDIASATSATYDAPAVSVVTNFRRVTTSTLNGVACSANSNCLTVTPNNVSSGSIAGDQKVCIGDDPAAFTSTTAGTGSGVVTYQWQSNTTGCGSAFNDIVGATSATYDPGVASVTTYYRRITISTLNGVVCSANSNCLTVTAESCAKALCTYTQGYYGNLGGMSCAPGTDGGFDKYTTLELIERALSSYSGGIMTIGSLGNTVVITNTPADRMAIIDVLPGGGSSYVLSGVHSISSLPSSYLTKKGTLNNTLLAQTITLGLNIGINGALGDFALQAGKITTAAPEGGCGSDIPKARSCNPDGTVNNEYQRYTISANVVNALTDKTVQGLFDLANTALGGGSTNGLSLSDIAGAVDAINNAFDGCRIFIGYDVPELECEITLAPTLTTSKTEIVGFDAYPVPFKDVLTIKYNFDYVSDVKIEVFNSTGKSVLSKSDTNSYLNKEVALNLKMNRGQEQVYVVKVTTNRGSSVKKVMSSK